MNEDQLLLARFRDLAGQSFNRNIYTYSEFLNPAEQSLLQARAAEFQRAGFSFYGGRPMADRQIACFGTEELLGYAPAYPVEAVCIRPLSEKFSEELSHRDYLGALMNLGIRRETLGDIVVLENKAYLFCLDKVTDFICEELTTIRRTSVTAERAEEELPELSPKLEEISLPVASLRADVIVAALCKLSRKQTLSLFEACEVTINGRVTTANAVTLKPGDIFSIRRHGKYVFEREGGTSRRGKIYVNLSR